MSCKTLGRLSQVKDNAFVLSVINNEHVDNMIVIGETASFIATFLPHFLFILVAYIFLLFKYKSSEYNYF